MRTSTRPICIWMHFTSIANRFCEVSLCKLAATCRIVCVFFALAFCALLSPKRRIARRRRTPRPRPHRRQSKARIPRRRHRHRLPLEDPRQLARHADIPAQILARMSASASWNASFGAHRGGRTSWNHRVVQSGIASGTRRMPMS